MLALSLAKRVALATGLYRPARWLSTRLRRRQLETFREEVALFRSLLPPASLCFDVGANIGDISVALLAAGAGRVVAFEPNPAVLPELRARCGHDPRWTLVEAAVGRVAGVQTFYAHLAHGASSLVPQWGGEIASQIQVEVTTLDTAIASFGVPDYCKIDVEGFEQEVLSGLGTRLPLISFEFHLDPSGIARARSCLARLAELTGGEVNVTPAESARFHFSDWRDLREFMDWFPGDLRQSLPGYPYGDIYVRTK
jgi:FkbM family methyltransferase